MVGWEPQAGGDSVFEGLYGLGGLAYPDNDDDDDDDGGGEDSEVTPSHRPRKRRFR